MYITEDNVFNSGLHVSIINQHLIKVTETQWELAEAKDESFYCKMAARFRDDRNQGLKRCLGFLLLSSLHLSTSPLSLLRWLLFRS